MGTYVRTQTIDHTVGEHGSVSLSITEGDVQARGVPGGDAHVRGTFEIRAASDADADRIFEQIQLRVTRGSGTLTVGEQNGGPSLGSVISRIFGGGGHADLTVEAEIPAAAQLRISSVSADTEVSGMRGEQRYSTVSGDLQLRDVGGSVRLDTVSGDANLRTEEPIAVQAQGVSGDVSVTAPMLRSLQANTVSGDVELEAELDPRGSFRVETVSGDLVVGLVGNATFEVHGISTDVSSELDHRLEGQVDRRRLIIGSGGRGPRLAFNSMSGDLEVRRPRRIAPAVPAKSPAPATQLEILHALERGEIDVDEATRRLAGGV
ncbi:MAG: DUF4097 family beta strand repeat-containing protein [Candidatus Limnocylindria bacterium]